MPKKQILRTPWTTDSVLDDCVYVLLRQYVKPLPPETSICFYAAIGKSKKLIPVEFNGVVAFLQEHRNRRFVTYNAVDFHQSCMEQTASHEQRSVVWQLSRQSRLWDVAGIERRIRYATNGQCDPVNGTEGLEDLFSRYIDTKQEDLNLDNQVARLRDILALQLDRAVRELPIFRKWTELGENEYLGTDASNDNYLRAVSILGGQITYQQVIEADHDRYGTRKPHPSELPRTPYTTLERLRVNRRQNLALSASHGPLGVGLDLQAALIADTLDRSACLIDRSRLEAVANNLRLRSHNGIKNLGKEVEACFKWQEKVGKDGEKELYFIKLEDIPKSERNLYKRNLREMLEKEIGRFLRVCKVSIDLPRNPNGSLSLKYVDWIPFRRFSRFIKLWTDLEVSTVIQEKLQKNEEAICDYLSFPCLKSEMVDVLSESVEEYFLAPRAGYKFAEIRLADLYLRSALATNVAAYGLCPEMHGESYDDKEWFPDNLRQYFATNIDRILNDKRNPDAQPDLVWNSLPDEVKHQVIEQMAESGVNQESTDSVRHRLQMISVSMPPREATYLRSLIWELLVRHTPPKEWSWQVPESRNYFSPGPDVTKHSIEVLPKLMDESRLSEILFQVTVNHFSYRFGISRDRQADSFVNQVKVPSSSTPTEAACWSIVDRLDKMKHQVKTLLASRYFVEFEKPAPYVSASLSDDDLFKTNGVSCLGRIGELIHYANVIAADIELFRRDVSLRIAFDLIASEYDVVWVSDQVITVRFPTDSFGAVSNAMAAVVRQTATEIFQAASVANAGFAPWLAAELCQFKLTGQWLGGSAD